MQIRELLSHLFTLEPCVSGPCSETPENIDYDFAQQELMMQQFMNDPIQEAITSVEKQHEEDKQGECHNPTPRVGVPTLPPG